MSHVADSPKSRHFEPISGRFTPIRPTNQRQERKWRPTSWHPGNVGGPPWPLFSRLTPQASRPTLRVPRRDQRGQVVRRPSPAGYCLTPNAELPRILRGPITPIGPPFLVYHWMDDSCGPINPSSPLAAARLLTIRSWREALDATGSKRARQCTSTSFGSCSSYS